MPAERDSRECPGPISEATLHCPSPSRALTAGAFALAVISPAFDPVEHTAEAVQPVAPEAAETAPTSADSALVERAVVLERTTRAHPRNTVLAPALPVTEVVDQGPAQQIAFSLSVADERPALRTSAAQAAVDQRDAVRGAVVAQSAALSVAEERTLLSEERSAAIVAAQRRHAALIRRAVQVRKAAQLRRWAQIRQALRIRQAAATVRTGGEVTSRRVREVVRPVTRYKRSVTSRHVGGRTQRVMKFGNGMTAVIAFARAQVGKRYVSGGEGPYGFDCSGFTKRAYALAGIRLPHSSGAQAARARAISRQQARPGDLVVGPGHVGIYMGRGMMIDAGNSRTGVVYRKLYSGLRVARVR